MRFVTGGEITPHIDQAVAPLVRLGSVAQEELTSHRFEPGLIGFLHPILDAETVKNVMKPEHQVLERLVIQGDIKDVLFMRDGRGVAESVLGVIRQGLGRIE